MRSLLAMSIFLSAPAVAQGLLEERVVLASLLAHVVIIEAQSKESIFFEHCQYLPPTGHGHLTESEIAANNLSNCNPIGPILPNTPAVREFLEARFTDALNQGLQKLDEASYALPIAGASVASGVLTGAFFAGVEAWAGRLRPSGPPRPKDILTVFGFTGVIAGAAMLVYKRQEARDARYEQRRSKQIQKVIDLRIPPEPHLIDERATSRGEARQVMRLFTRALTQATEQTRRAAVTLATATP